MSASGEHFVPAIGGMAPNMFRFHSAEKIIRMVHAVENSLVTHMVPALCGLWRHSLKEAIRSPHLCPRSYTHKERRPFVGGGITKWEV
jgi:hypothetical protein